ncbi:MAG: hypothetical protein MR270_03140 [Erysipelotrichaceae bacterium]|nr:hypothetical protein [Erysipelotrichaceae bacterium]
MHEYITPDMKIYEGNLIKEYEAFASSGESTTCTTYGKVECTTLATGCTANSSGCGNASYCTTKSS